MRIASVVATRVRVPLAAPRLHSDGVTRALDRTVLEMHTDEGLVGLGELGARTPPARVEQAIRALVGLDPFQTEEIRNRLVDGKFPERAGNILFAGFEMACLDVQGKAVGRPVADLLGGAMRNRIPTTAYVFPLLGHVGAPEVRDVEDVVDEATRVVSATGCSTIKFKAGSGRWREDVEVMRALRVRFPQHELRVDPNGVWSLGTAMRAAAMLRGLSLEWLEDPVLGVAGMAEVTARGGIPTATNMCLTDWYELSAAIAARAVDTVLLDIYYLGGLRSAMGFARACAAWQLGVGIHSGGAGTSELGIGTAAFLHLAAALPTLIPAMDSMYSHLLDDVIGDGVLRIDQGAFDCPTGPGLGVELDQERLGRYADLYRQRALEEPSRRRPTYPRY